MLKRFSVLFLTILLVLMVTVPAFAATPKILLNGQELIFDTPPTIENQRTLVPFRTIFEALGANVWFDESTGSAMGEKGSLTIQLPLGQQQAIVNGQAISLDVPAKIVNGRTLVPLRFVSENMGCTVTPVGDLNNLTIHITSATQKKLQENNPGLWGTPNATTPQPNQQSVIEQPAATSGKYVGSAKSDKYHQPGCRHAKKIIAENAVWFKDINDARTQGYAPCGVCKP